MRVLFKEHIDRIREGVDNVFNLNNLSKYVEKYLYVEGKRYEFGDRYGFQATIINDTSRVTNTVKPAQIGLTTANMAYLLSAAATQRKFNSIYSLPTTSDAQKLVVTKLDPMIAGSPEIKRLLDYNVDNNELKKIGGNFIFIRGSKSETAAISISADCLVADEIDRSDPDTLKQFRSRLQASEFQIVKQFSTPTVDGVGISKEAEASRRFRHFCKCVHCNHTWLPSYHTDIVIPGFDDDLSSINKNNIKDIRWQEAHWKCPSCGQDPKMHPSRLQWVCENPVDNYEPNTYFVSPVTACLVLRPYYLVRTSTEFNTRSEWKNQVLGETSEEDAEQMVLSDLTKAEIEGTDLMSTDPHYMGVDMGLECAITIGRETPDGVVVIVHREMVPITKFEERRFELIRQFRVVLSVHDALPYTTEIMRICAIDPRAFAAQFAPNTKNPELFTLQEKKEDPQEAQEAMRLVKVNRTVGLDQVRDLFKENKFLIQKQDNADKLRPQYVSLKRVQVYVRDERVFQWQKTDGNDHMMFSALYLVLALRLRTKVGGFATPMGVPLVSKYVVKSYTQSA